MAKDEPSKASILLNQARTYEKLEWLGIFFVPLAIVFWAMCSSKLREANLYKLSEVEQNSSIDIKKSS